MSKDPPCTPLLITLPYLKRHILRAGIVLIANRIGKIKKKSRSKIANTQIKLYKNAPALY